MMLMLMLIIGANADHIRPVGCKACEEGVFVNEAGTMIMLIYYANAEF